MKINHHMIQPCVFIHGGTIGLYATVNDAQIRECVDASFNGFERVFALVPRESGNGGLHWVRHGLIYTGSYSEGATREIIDTHSLYLGTIDIDLGALHRYGVAFGADIDPSQTIWCQTDGDNYIPDRELATLGG
jgi:hypothetical protein